MALRLQRKGQAILRHNVFQCSHDRHSVRFTGVKYHANACGIQATIWLDQLHLLAELSTSDTPGNVSAAGFPAWRQLALYWVEFTAEKTTGIVLVPATAAWAEGVAMATMASGFITNKFTRDLCSSAGITLGALVLPFKVFAFFIACFV